MGANKFAPRVRRKALARENSTLPLKLLLFLFHGANMIIISFLPLHLQHNGLTSSEVGLVMAIGPFIAIFSQPFWGYMSDKYQTVKKILMICFIALMISSYFFLQMTSLTFLIISGAFFFFFSAPIGGLGDSLSQRRAEQLNISFGSIRTWGSIGFGLSSLTVGELLTRIGIEFLIWPYLILAGGAFIASTLLVDVKVDAPPIRFQDIGKLLRIRPYVIFLILMVFLTISHRANDSFLGIYIADLGGSEAIIGYSWFSGVASEAIVFATAGWWFRKYHPLLFMVIAGALYSLRWLLYSFLNTPEWIVALQFLHGFTFGIFYLTAFHYVSRLIPKAMQSTGHLVFVSVFFGISGIFGSLMGGTIMDNAGGEVLYLTMGLLTLVGTIFLLLYHLYPQLKKAS